MAATFPAVIEPGLDRFPARSFTVFRLSLPTGAYRPCWNYWRSCFP